MHALNGRNDTLGIIQNKIKIKKKTIACFYKMRSDKHMRFDKVNEDQCLNKWHIFQFCPFLSSQSHAKVSIYFMI